MNKSSLDNADVIAPPPLIYFGTLAVGLIVHYFVPIQFLPSGVNSISGALLLIVGLTIAFSSFIAMRRADTSPDPREPVRALVTGGPFHFTRNPIYLGLALIYLGIVAAINALAALVLFPIALIIIHFGVIAREEEYLAQRFGDVYLQYQARVRRWL